MSSDDAVRGTNDDATSCKRSAVELNYYADPHVQYFAKKSRKPPLINRGYYTRVYAIERLIDRFLQNVPDEACSQIINLGCGFDTLYWRLLKAGRCPNRFVEVDYDQVTAKKCGIIRRHAELQAGIETGSGSCRNNGMEIHADKYHLVAVDLRDINTLMDKLQASGVDFQQPTLFLAECVLIYLQPEEAKAIITLISEKFSCPAFINYEQIRPDDRFGHMMVRNLEERECPLLGIHSVPDTPAQEARFIDGGWDDACSTDMLSVWASIQQEERARVGRLEIFDELEEWEAIMKHYCLTCAWKQTAIWGSNPLPQAIGS